MNGIAKHKKLLLVGIVIVIFIAGLLDIKYKGLFFQTLPKSIQTYLANLF